jgi:hypothetical protein
VNPEPIMQKDGEENKIIKLKIIKIMLAAFIIKEMCFCNSCKLPAEHSLNTTDLDYNITLYFIWV